MGLGIPEALNIKRKSIKMSNEIAKRESRGVMRKASALEVMATRLGVEPDKMLACLKDTCFKGVASNEQMMALVVVANAYKLNPFTKEIYAFPDSKSGGIVPMVSVDGWCRIINEHPQLDGIQFELHDNGASCTCTIYRKDRKFPTVLTEYLAECKRSTAPWNQSPKRMLRHKALIQCARVAFGFAGIYDEDDAKKIIEREADDVEVMGVLDGVDEVTPTAKEPKKIKGASQLKNVLRKQGKLNGDDDKHVIEDASVEGVEQDVAEAEQEQEALDREMDAAMDAEYQEDELL